MAENTAGQGHQPEEEYPHTVTDSSSATPPPPPSGYTPTEMYQPPVAPQQPGTGQPPAMWQSGAQPQLPPQQSGPAYAPTQAYTPQGQPLPQPPVAPQQGAQPYGGGYGYPPQAQQPYPPQGGYPPPVTYPQQGYPQQPGPYQQQVPPQQAQPPYPQTQPYPQAQPPYPQPVYPTTGYPMQPPVGGRGARKGLVFGIIGGVLALAIIATVVAVLTNGSSGSSSAGGTTLSKLWTVPSAGSEDQTVGSWLTSDAVVRAGATSGVSAYDIHTGLKTWSVTPPSGATKPCAMSPTVNSSGIGTVGFGTDDNSCKYIVGIDSATGTIIWKVILTDSDHPVATDAQTFIQGSVATILSEGRVGGFNTATGKQIWINAARGKYCNEEAFGTTGAVVVDDFCADVSPERTLTALNPATGKRLWRKTESATIVEGTFLDGKPMVAILSPSEKAPVSIYSSTGTTKPFDTTGLLLEGDDVLSVGLPGGGLAVQSAMDTSDSSSTAGKVIAYSLTSGQKLWTYNGESQHGAVLAQPTGNGSVYALSTGTFDGVPHFVRLDPTTGTSTVLGALPANDDNFFVGESTIYATPGNGLLTVGSGYQSTDEAAIALYQ